MALNNAALAYSNKIMNDYLNDMDEATKNDWERTYPDVVQRDEIMRTKAFESASWGCDSKYNELENESFIAADKADKAAHYASIVRNGGGNKKDYENLGLGEDFIPLNDYTEKTGWFGLSEADRKGLNTKLAEMQGDDENAVAVREDLTARIERYTSIANAQELNSKKYNEQFAQFTDNMAMTKAEKDLASAFARGASEEEINSLSTEWAKLNVDYYEKYEKDMSVNSQADAAKAYDRASEIASFKELLGIEDDTKPVSEAQSVQATVSEAEKESVKTEPKSKTADQSEVKTESTETEVTETKTVEVNEVKAASDEKSEPVSEKPNPYAFEKPAPYPDMPGSAYEEMCRQAEAAHIKEVNAKVADEIWNEGKWGNGQERIDKLTAAGYDVAGVQAAVNEKIAKINETTATKTVSVETPEMKSVETNAADIKTNQTVSDESEKSDASASKDDSGKSTKSWTDEKGNKITDVTVTDKDSPLYNTKMRSIECPDGKTWSIAYGADGKRDNSRCIDPNTNTITDIKYNESGYKELAEVYDMVGGRSGKIKSATVYDGTENETKLRDAKYDHENGTITERYFDVDGNVIKSDSREMDSGNAVSASESETKGFQPAAASSEKKAAQRRSLEKPAEDKVLDRTEEKPKEDKTADLNGNGSIYNNIPADPYIKPGEVKPFNAYVNEPAFDPHLDVPKGDLSVDVPKGSLKVDVPAFDPKVDIKIDPYLSANDFKDSGSPKRASSSRFDTGVHMADNVSSSGKSASYSNGPDAD